jgi:NitT/TauT family transport system permease protein
MSLQVKKRMQAVTVSAKREQTGQRRAFWTTPRLRFVRVLGAQVLLAVGLLGLWELGVRLGWVDGFLFGQPSAIWTLVVKGLADGSTLHDVYITSSETVLGFLIGNSVGAVVGLLLWYWPFVHRVVKPFVVALGSIPIIALAPLVVIWAGTDLESKVLMSTISVVVPALLAAYEGAKNADPLKVNLLYSMSASKWQGFRMVVIPSSLTYIFAGLKLTVGFALVGAIIGEFISAKEGLGHAIFIAGSLYNIPRVFAALLATIVIALVFVYVVGRIERLLLPWRKVNN